MNSIRGFCIALAVYAGVAGTTAAMAADKMMLHKVTDDVYMMQNERGSSNSTFVVTKDGVLVFDFDVRTAPRTLAELRKDLTNQPGEFANYKRPSRLRNFINRVYYQLQEKGLVAQGGSL
jgi:hypothetical protein